LKMPGIELSNGHVLSYVIASGGLGYDGHGWLWDQPLRMLDLMNEQLFTTVMKTGTLGSRIGNYRWWNPLRCISYLPDGSVVNATGLSNPGIHCLHRKIKPKIDSRKSAVIGSILGEPDELAEMARILNDVDFVGLEDNASCPNTESDLLGNSEKVIRGLEAIKQVTRFPLIVKLSVAHDIPWIVERAEGLVEAISINSVPWVIAFPGKKSPLDRLGGGGVSGKAAQPFTWKLVRELANMTDIPVIGPSICDYGDINTLIGFGAQAVSFGSVLMPNPYRPLNPLRPTALVRRHMRENM